MAGSRDSKDLLDPAVARMLHPALDQPIEDHYVRVFRRYEFRERMRARFETIDLLVTPTTPCAAFADERMRRRGRPTTSFRGWLKPTPSNLTGQRAAPVPVGFSKSGLPIGLQMVVKINHKTDVFRAAAAYEHAQP